MNIQELITQVETLQSCFGVTIIDYTVKDSQAKFLKEVALLKRTIADSVLRILKLEQSKPYRLDLLRFADLLKVNGRLDPAMITDVRLALQSMELESIETPHPYKLYFAKYSEANPSVRYKEAAAAKAYWNSGVDKVEKSRLSEGKTKEEALKSFVRHFKRILDQ